MTRFRIDADLLIPGASEPIGDGTVLIEDDQIAFAGPTAEAPTGTAPHPASGADSSGSASDVGR